MKIRNIKRNLIKIGMFVGILGFVFLVVNNLLSINNSIDAQSLSCDIGYNLQTVDFVTKCCKDTTYLNHDVAAATFLCKGNDGVKQEYTKDPISNSGNGSTKNNICDQKGLLLIGDSLTAGVRDNASNLLQNRYGGKVVFSQGAVDGKPAYPLLNQTIMNGASTYSGKIVVIHVGTNGFEDPIENKDISGTDDARCRNKMGLSRPEVIEQVKSIIRTIAVSSEKTYLVLPRLSNGVNFKCTNKQKPDNIDIYLNTWIQNFRDEMNKAGFGNLGNKLEIVDAQTLWGTSINFIDGIHSDVLGYRYMANKISETACGELIDPNMVAPGNGSSGGGGTTPGGGPKVVNPTSYTNLQPGTITNACKLGANSAVELPRLTDGNNYFGKPTGDVFMQRNYNFGWVLSMVNSMKDMDSELISKTAQDLSNSGTRLILRICKSTEGCEIADPNDVDKSARMYARKLAKIAISLSQYSDSKKYDVSLWAIAGLNEPDLNAKFPASFSALYMNKVAEYLSQPGTFVCANASTDEMINSDTYKCPGEMGWEEYFKYRGHINLISPVMADADTKYLDSMYASKPSARFEDVVGIAMNLYPFDFQGNGRIETIRKAIDYVKSKNKKLFILETGVAPGTIPPGNAYSAATDEWATKIKYDMVLQTLNSPYVEAILLFNGLPLSGKQTNQTVNSEIEKQSINGPVTRGEFIGNGKENEKNAPKYDKDQYYANRRLENTTGSEYPRVTGAYTAIAPFGTIPDLSDKSHWKACRYSIALAQGDILDKNGYPTDSKKYYDIRLSYPTTSYDCSFGDIAEPTTRMNPDWMYFYESQIYDMLDAAGCSNRYTFSCQNNLAQTNINDGSTAKNTTSTNSDVKRMSYADLTQKAVAVEKTLDGANKAYFDLPDKKLIIGNSEEFAKSCIGYNYPGCVYVGQFVAGGVCLCTKEESYEWQNIPIDVIYYGSVYTSVRMDVPTSRALVSTRADGTDDLNYNHYGQIMRSSYTGNLTEDLSRKVSSNIQLLTPMGRQVSIPHSIGTAVDLYGYDPTDYSINTDQVNGNSYVQDPNSISESFNPKNYFREIPTGATLAQLMSPTASRTDLLTTNQGTKLLKYYADKFFTQTKDTSGSILKIDSTIQMNQDVKNQIKRDINVKNYTLDDINGKIQINASEIQSDEYIVDMKSVDEQDGVSCAKLFNNYKPQDKSGGDIPEIGNVLPMKYYVIDNELQKYDYADKCGNKADYPQAKLVKKVNGKVVETVKVNGTDKGGQFSLLNPICYVSYCRSDPPRILDNQTKFADYTVIPYLQSIPPARFTTFQDINGIKTKVAFAKSDYEPLTGHFLKQVEFDTPTIQSASGMLQVIRTTWQANQRFEFENYNTNPAIRQDLTGNVSQRICINQNYSVQTTLFTRAYSTSQLQGYNLGLVGPGACMNPNNGGMYGYKRPMVQPNKQYATSTAEFPWLGTVTALNERMSLLKFNINTSGNTPLSKCGAGNNDLVCLCDNTLDIKRDLNAKESKYKWDAMAIYLCQNNMLTYDEMVQADLLDLTIPTAERETRKDEYNPFKCNVPQFTSNVPITVPINGAFCYAGVANNCANGSNPYVQQVLDKVEKVTGIPKNVITAIWSNESSCTMPQNVTDYNSLVTGTSGPGVNAATATGPMQITDNTWKGVMADKTFRDCLKAVGVDNFPMPDRFRFGDAICGGAIVLKFKESGLSSSPKSECNSLQNQVPWSSLKVQCVANGYLGWGGCNNSNGGLYKIEDYLNDGGNGAMGNQTYCALTALKAQCTK